MPKKEIDYSGTVIYKIQHIEKPELIYVGHTTDFTKRKYHHKSCANNIKDNPHYHLKVYTMIREHGGWEMFNMVEVEKFPCMDRREAEAKEDKVMREMKASLNTYRSYLTEVDKLLIQKEYGVIYRESHREKQRKYDIDYYKANKEKKTALIACACGRNIQTHSIRKHERTKRHLEKVSNN